MFRLRSPRSAWAAILVVTAGTVGFWFLVDHGGRRDGALLPLIAARLSDRPTPLRWPSSGGAYLPPTTVRRGPPGDLASRLAALNVSLDEEGPLGHALVLLAAGSGEDAVAPLERAMAADPHDLVVIRALAAAYAARASNGNDPRDWPRSLDLTARLEQRLGQSAEVLFNRAMILEQLGMSSAARLAWLESLRLEASGPWAEEARAHVHQLEQRIRERQPDANIADTTDVEAAVRQSPADARQFAEIDGPAAWGRAMLTGDTDRAHATESKGLAFAQALQAINRNTMAVEIWRVISNGATEIVRSAAAGHVALRDGLDLYDRDLRTQAAEKFASAQQHLRAAQSPAWLWAEIQLAVIANQRRDRPTALKHLDKVRNAVAHRTYPSLLAREAMLRGVVLFMESGAAAAFPEYRAGITLYEQQREFGDAASSYNTAADSARMVGDPFEGWGYVAGALNRIDYVRTTFRRYQVYFSAANLSLHDGLLDAALTFQDLALAEARGRGPTGVGFVVEALIRRSIILSQRGDTERSADDLDEAERLLPTIPEPATQSYHRTWVRARRASAVMAESPALARQLLESAVSGFRLIEPSGVPALLAERARAALALGEIDRGFAELQSAALELERRRLQLSELGGRISYFDDSWRLYQDLVSASLAAEGDWYRALRLAEDARARSLVETRSPSALPDLPSLQSSMGSTSVLVYFVLPDATLWWKIGATSFDHGQVDIDESALTARVDQLSRTLEEGTTRDARTHLEWFHDAFLKPAFQGQPPSTLLIVPDGALHRVPFAALRDRSRQRYLVQDTAVSISPSVRIALDASAALAQPGSRALRALSVGRAEALPAAGLPALPNAVDEVESVAAQYPNSIILLRDRATPSSFLHELQQADVVHFAGHAVANNAFPSLSYLLLNPDATSQAGALFGYQLLTLPSMRTRLVVLAACRTGSGAVPKGEGPLSLAWPLLAAGVPSVVASLWDLDDAAARAIMPELHRAFAAGQPPANALRLAQLSFLQHDEDVTKWGALVAIGATRLK